MKNNYVVLVEQYDDDYYGTGGGGYFYDDKLYEYPTYEKAEKGLWDYVRYLKRHCYRESQGDYEIIVENVYYPNARQIIITVNNENDLYSNCWRITARKRLSSD